MYYSQEVHINCINTDGKQNDGKKKNTANNKQKEIGEAIYIFNKIEFKI